MAKKKKLIALTRAEVVERLNTSAFNDRDTLDAAVAMLTATCATCAKFHKHDPRHPIKIKGELDGYCGHFYSNVKRTEGCNAHEPR
jgi:hypothetical protein